VHAFEATPEELSARLGEFAAATFADLESAFLAMPRGTGFVDYVKFQHAYEVLKRSTAAFHDFSAERVWAALLDDSLAFVVVRAILGMSAPEWAYLATTECEVPIDQGYARTLDRRVRADQKYFARVAGEAPSQRVKALVEVACKHIAAGAPPGAADTVHRLDKLDTAEGLPSLRTAAQLHVPYAMVLYERFLGRPFASHRDAVSELIGEVMESAIEKRLAAAHISHRRTGRAERLPGFDQAPDFVIPDEKASRVAIEAKLTNDDGTARDKVTRILRLVELSRRRVAEGGTGFQVIACIDGRGFAVRRGHAPAPAGAEREGVHSADARPDDRMHGPAGITVTSDRHLENEDDVFVEDEWSRMQSVYFAPLDRPISRLVLGTMVFSLDALDLTYELMDAWREAGGNIVDTAHLYQGGNSERALGRYLADRGCREEIVILAKGAHHNADRRRVTPEDITCDLRDTLARLKTDYVDLYVLHRDDPGVPVGPIVEALNEHRRAGRVRALGASNWTPERLDEANAYAVARGLEGFSLSSPHLSLAVPNGEIWTGCVDARSAEAREWYRQRQMPLFAWSAQARGFFSGRFSPENLEDENVVRIYYSEDNWERLRRARDLGERHGCSATQVALAWVLHQPFPVFPLVGPANVVELRSCVTATTLNLSPEEIRWLDLG